MISIGIDISKDKSTICALKSGSETIWKPFDLKHLQSDMQSFISKLEALTGELRIVMEATGKYHLPILYSLKSKGYFVTVVNPSKFHNLKTLILLISTITKKGFHPINIEYVK
jgi:transposase